MAWAESIAWCDAPDESGFNTVTVQGEVFQNLTIRQIGVITAPIYTTPSAPVGTEFELFSNRSVRQAKSD